ncbi:MAG: hypothetical protein AAF961_15075, partial [Planctomycetota bacterium]
MTDPSSSPRPIDPLLQMPKPPVGDLVTCTAGHARALYGLSIGLQVVAGLAYAPLWWFAVEKKTWWFAVVFPLCALPTVLLIAIGVHLWAWMERKRFADLQRGFYYVHWRYGPAQWTDYCRRDVRQYRWLGAILVACGAGMALVVALLTHLDAGEVWWGNLPAHYGWAFLCGGGGGFF